MDICPHTVYIDKIFPEATPIFYKKPPKTPKKYPLKTEETVSVDFSLYTFCKSSQSSQYVKLKIYGRSLAVWNTLSAAKRQTAVTGKR
jgi:hypothetical protein